MDDMNKHTIKIGRHKKAISLKLLAHEYIEEDYETSDTEEEEEKKEEQMDTDEENMMYSDNDCPDLTSSEDEKESSDEGSPVMAPEDILQMGAQAYLDMKAKADDLVLPKI